MKIPKIIQCHIHYLSENQINISETNKIYDALNNLLNGEFQTSDFNIRLLSNQLNDIDFQKIMSTINEKQQARAINGVYYTPPDVVNFIIFNCFNKIIAAKDDIIINEINTNLEYVDIESLIFSKQIFDPTCGSGEFLISALQHKVDLYSKNFKNYTWE
jgi:type I restriction-modification system DNA methylase subunit